MKLSEIKGERAIEVFADLLEPVSKILSDEAVLKSFRSSDPKVVIVQKILKGHAKDVIQALAILEGVPVEEYEIDFLTLPSKLIEFFNDPAIAQLFTSQSQSSTPESSGSATANTEESGN